MEATFSATTVNKGLTTVQGFWVMGNLQAGIAEIVRMHSYFGIFIAKCRFGYSFVLLGRYVPENCGIVLRRVQSMFILALAI